MVTKTFRSESMLKALQMVQDELGSDAIVVSTREIPTGPSWNPWKQSAVEIVAATPDTLPNHQPPKPEAPRARTQGPLLRPAANNKGVEFVDEEETPEIEWADDVEQDEAPAPEKPGPARRRKTSPGAKQWEPPRVDKKNTAAAEKSPEKQAPARPLAVTQTPIRLAPSSSKLSTKSGVEESHLPTGLRKVYNQLYNQGVDPVLIDGLINLAIETLSEGALSDHETCKKYIVQLLSAELRTQQGIGVYLPSNVVCLVGGSGSGKTSTVAKLALFFAQKLKKNITWVCADTVRMGAITEARTFTDALGISLKLVYSPEDIREILQGARENDLFLVDTPGYNPCSESQMVELGGLLVEMPKRCTYLVASATTKETDLYQLTASLGVFNLDGLIVTKLDETHTFGSVYNFSRKTHVPLSFFTTGKEVARNLEVVDPARLVLALFGKEWNK